MEGAGLIYGAGRINPNDEIYLLISKAAYVDKMNRPVNIMGYNYDSLLSDAKNAIYVNNQNGTVIIGFRGTVPTLAEDLFEDGLIVAGKFNSGRRLPETIKLVEIAIQKYPNYTFSFTGHSLGGRIALEIGKLQDLKNSKAVGFNAAITPIDIQKNLLDKTVGKFRKGELDKKRMNFKLYTSIGDPVSISGTREF